MGGSGHRSHPREQHGAGGAHRLERDAIGQGGRSVAADAGEAQIIAGDAVQLESPGVRCDSERLRLERATLIRVDSEQRQHLGQRGARPDRGEERVQSRRHVAADIDARRHYLGDGRARQRRDRAHEGLGRAAGVEHVPVAVGAGPHSGAEVIVAADGEHRAMGAFECPVGVQCAGGGTGGHRLRHQPRGCACPVERLVPPDALHHVEHPGPGGE